MKFKKFTLIYFFLGILGIGTILSFSTNPPNAHTGAPGDGVCTECHNPSNPLGLDGEFSLTGFPTLRPLEGIQLPKQIQTGENM